MRLTPIGLLVPAVCLLTGGVTLVAGAGVDKKKADTIHACAKKQDGRMRMVAGAANCKRGERAMQWNVVGPQGPAGTQGPAGAPGAARAGRSLGATGAGGPARPNRAGGGGGPAGGGGEAGGG